MYINTHIYTNIYVCACVCIYTYIKYLLNVYNVPFIEMAVRVNRDKQSIIMSFREGKQTYNNNFLKIQ